MRRNVAVILAGGTGTRAGVDVPKQFLKIAGKSVLEHTVDVFQRHARIDEIAIVANTAYHGLVAEMIVRNNWAKVKRVLAAGSQRYESSLSAIRAYAGSQRLNLIFHDAVRPLVSPAIISDVISALEVYKAVDTAVPAVDTIIAVDPTTNVITHVPERRYLRRGQTPQGFHLEIIEAAYARALKDPEFSTTDDCGVVVKYLPDVSVCVVPGDESNMKLTYVEDVYLIEKLFQLRSQAVGEGSSISGIAGAVVVVIGGTSGIGQEIVNLCRREKARVYAFSRSAGNVDVRDRSSVERALRQVVGAEGRIDYVVNTAGVLYRQPFHLTDDKTIDEIIQTNMMGVVNVSLASFSHLRKTRGQLLHFASSSYTRGRPLFSLYSATKAATVNFVQAIAEEWESFGIRVNCISPERTRTPMRQRNFGVESDVSLLDPKYVAEIAVRTLLSGYSGQVIDVRNDAVDAITMKKMESNLV